MAKLALNVLESNRTDRLDGVALIPEKVTAEPDAELGMIGDETQTGAALDLANRGGDALRWLHSEQRVHVILTHGDVEQLVSAIFANLRNELVHLSSVPLLEDWLAP